MARRKINEPSSRGLDDARARNLLRPAILVLLKEHGSHGYELVSRLQEMDFEVPDFGGLYRALRVMEDDGLVESEWGNSERGPARRIYTMTPAGNAYLREAAPGLVHQRRAIGEMLARYRISVRSDKNRQRRRSRVLVVEDDDDLRHTLWILLEQHQWVVVEAADGEGALNEWGREEPDVVVVDYRLPGVSGMDVARQLREAEFEGPIVLYSAYLTPALEDEAAILGLQTLTKTDVAELVNTLDACRTTNRRSSS